MRSSLPSTYPDATSAVTLLHTISPGFFLLIHVFTNFKKPVISVSLTLPPLTNAASTATKNCVSIAVFHLIIYLGIAELREGNNGRLSFNGSGQLIDYAVKMVRLPEQRMMANSSTKTMSPLQTLLILHIWSHDSMMLRRVVPD